ncbi:MAG: pyrimidine/purine nucleoside phosphorylase [Akkermansiaceae bacterium]
MTFKNVTAEAKGNIYFDGKVVSHKITLEDNTTKTLGIMFQGDYHFGTEKAERMDVTDGTCTVTLDGSDESNNYTEGEYFEIPANSGFDIKVTSSTCQYVCSYID